MTLRKPQAHGAVPAGSIVVLYTGFPCGRDNISDRNVIPSRWAIRMFLVLPDTLLCVNRVVIRRS